MEQTPSIQQQQLQQTAPPTAPTINPPQPNAQSETHRGYLLALIMLIAGVVIGYFLFELLPDTGSRGPEVAAVPEKVADVALPRDAERIQLCSEHRGSLYVKPQDIPTGPIYMVYDGKVIGLEYMLAQDQFLAGKTFSDLKGLGVPVDHVNTGLIEHGHAGYTKPHYHIDLYTVSKDYEQGIQCSGADSEHMDMPMTATPSGSVRTSTASGYMEGMEMETR